MNTSNQKMIMIVALRNEKGSYNNVFEHTISIFIVALRNEKGSYNAVATMGYAG